MSWTLAELQTALDRTVGQIAKATCTIGAYIVDGHVEDRPAVREARRRLPELRKVETLLMERIKEALAKEE